MSFRHSYDCFILRGRSGSHVLQRIQIRDTKYQKDMIAFPNSIAGYWTVQRREFSQEENVLAQKFQRYIRFTPLVMNNQLYPGTFIRIVVLWILPIPRREGQEILVGCIGDGGALSTFRQFVNNYRSVPYIYPTSREESQTIVQTIPQTVPRTIPRTITTHSYQLSHTFHMNDLINRVLQSHNIIPVSHNIVPAISASRIQALKPYVARVLAEAARNRSEDCPITLDSMASCRKLFVPTCGHVCSDEGCVRLEKCPVCRETTAWTPVEFA